MHGPNLISLSADVGAPPPAVWGLVRRFGDVAAWNPCLAESRLNRGEEGMIGAEREVVTRYGVEVREELVEFDDRQRTLTYRMLTFPIPVVAQRNRITVEPGRSDDRATVVFTAAFQPAAGAEAGDIADINRAAFTAAVGGLAASLDADWVIL